MEGDFEKIRQKNRTLYIKREYLSNGLVQELSGGVEKLRERYDVKIIPSSEFTRIYKFSIRVKGVDREVYLKQYLRRPTFHFIKGVFRGSQARRALKAELMLSRNNFDVPEAVAMVEHRLWFFHKISFSATFGIEDSKSVFQFICETRKPPQRSKIFLATENTPLPTICRGREDTEKKEKVRREMIREFGRTVGRMHAKNIFHGDLRLNNVLLRQEGGAWRFFFLDNERTRKFNKLPFRRRIQNLVQINMTPAEVMGKTDRMRFFKEYRAQTGTGKEKGKVLIAATIKGTIRRLQKQRKNRREPRKVQRTKGGNLWIETGNFRAMFSKVFPLSEEAPDFIENLERLIRAGQILREERNCIVSQIRWKDKEVVVKQYVPRGLIHSLKNTIWKSPAKQDWLNGHRLKMPNTAANKPLAYIERLKSGLIWKSYFVTEHNEL